MPALTEKTEIHELLFEDSFSARIAEMGSLDTLTLDVPVEAAKIAKIKERDPEAMFVIAEVESGWSGSKRNWTPTIVENAVKQINTKKPVGVLGHPLLKNDKAYETEFPDPQVVWLGGISTRQGNKVVARFKGYVLPGARARVLLENDAIDGVSWFGDTTLRPVKGGYEVVDFELESIDFARKGRSGMKSRIVTLTGEQESRGGTTVEPKDIAALDENELRTHAPLLVKEIERQATEPLNTKVGEMEAAVEAAKPELDILAKIKELMKLAEGENPIEKLQKLFAQIEETASKDVKDFIKSLVAKKVKDEKGQSIVNRMLGEMHSEYDGKTLDDALKTKIEEDFNSKVEADDDIKAVIGEMGGDGGREVIDGRGGAHLGGQSKPGEERMQGKTTETENITRRKRTLA
jgi:hypothetical protein